jgi:hypothetical protein
MEEWSEFARGIIREGQLTIELHESDLGREKGTWLHECVAMGVWPIQRQIVILNTTINCLKRSFIINVS